VPAVTRKIRRRRAPGELVVEQTRDLALVAQTLTAAGMLADGVDAPGGCYLTAYVGDRLAGVIGIEARVDAALIRSLMVVETDRRRGIGADLVAAARTAAHTRGARTLYALAHDSSAARYFERFGFTSATSERLIAALAGAFMVDYLRQRPDELARCQVLSLDIANDGVILR
jgi:N-acetylglutamate synthase-like GNAT family acetyltransferase